MQNKHNNNHKKITKNDDINDDINNDNNDNNDNKNNNSLSNTNATTNINSQIQKLKTELIEKDNLIKRIQADFENHMKRNEKEIQREKILSKSKLLLQFLPIVDSIESGISVEATQKSTGSLKGLLMIHEEILKFFKQNNVHEIKALNEEFNSMYHEALLAKKESESKKNKVIEVIQKGYMFNDIILRHAKVIIGK